MSFHHHPTEAALPGQYVTPPRSDQGAVVIYRLLWVMLLLAPVLCCGCAIAGYVIWVK